MYDMRERRHTGTLGRSGSGTCVGMSVSARSELSSASGFASSIAYTAHSTQYSNKHLHVFGCICICT